MTDSSFSKCLYRKYISKFENLITSNVKAFWNFVNARRRDVIYRATCALEMHLVLMLNDDLLADHFQSSYVHNEDIADL